MSSDSSSTTGGSTTTVPAGPVVPEDAPPIVNTGDDFEAIYRSLNEFINWLAANPSPTVEMIDVIYSPRGPAYELQRTQLAGNIAGGFHSAGRIQEVGAVEDRGPREGPGGSVIYDLIVNLTFPVVDYLDSEEQVVRTRDAAFESRFLISLLQDEGRWRIGDSVELI
ncbi:MAG: hypothetical protein M5U31_07150 [Acidimicrobiia bacterium]|nr:hypothetical protein [Acidimicrobiia bacterium]